MTIDDTKKIITKIKVFRPFFQTGNSSTEEINFRKEWFAVLEPYNFEDVDRKLNEYFKDGENIGRIPDPYYLVKYLKTNSEKRNANGLWVRCNLCQNEYSLQDYENHYGRCSSANYIINMTKIYYQQDISRDKLLNMSEEEFEKRYLNFITKLSDKVTDIDEKKRLKKLARLLNGEDVKFSLDEMKW